MTVSENIIINIPTNLPPIMTVCQEMLRCLMRQQKTPKAIN